MEENRNVELDYVDSMMIIDKDYKIIYTNRFNPRFSDAIKFKENEYSVYFNKYYFDVYPKLDSKESSMVEVLNTGKTVLRESQSFTDFNGIIYTTNNITYPIMRSGVIVGAMELSQDITSVGDLIKNSNISNKKKERPQSKSINDLFTFEDIITNSSKMMDNIKKAKIFALDDSPTLIYGETGTGKELFVEAMVNINNVRNKKYVAQNCAAIPETLFESILFGSVKGAFTGSENKIGLFEMANNGVLFLDELNSMPIHLQAKLLRVLQDGKVRPIGSTIEKRVNVKVIIAMNKNPMDLIKLGQLREDLFYRLSSNTIYLTPLRERIEDVLIYSDYFVNLFNQKYDKSVEKISSSLKKMMLKYEWPGNVREIRHVIQSMVHLSEEKILTTNHMPAYLKEMIDTKEDNKANGKSEANNEIANRVNNSRSSLKEMLEKVEKEYILRALSLSDGNVTRAAEQLDMPRQTLKFRMDKLNIINSK